MDTFDCTVCAIEFARKSNLDRHITTKKHIDKVENNDFNPSPKKTFSCVDCSRSYLHRSGLSKHKHQCKKKNSVSSEEVEKMKCQFETEKKVMQKQINDLMVQAEKLSTKNTSYLPVPIKRKAINKDMRRYIVGKQDKLCGQCKQVLTPYFQIDHIIGLQFGGTNDESNLMAVCCECHTMKSIAENQCRKKIQETIQTILREKMSESV